MSKDTLSFPLSAFTTAAEISLSLEAGRAQLGQAEGPEATLDEYIQEAGFIASSNLALITYLRTSVQMLVFAADNSICGHVVKAGLIAALSSRSGATRHYSR